VHAAPAAGYIVYEQCSLFTVLPHIYLFDFI